MEKVYLKGLNSLRFFAAFFVIIQHGEISLWKLGVNNYGEIPLFNRGGDAVEFFFVLSGFLITYLLQNEIKQTNTVSIKAFYLRRVFRIWPLYFLIIIIGFIILGWIYPKLTGQHFFTFSIVKGLLLYVFFLPNLATSMYPAGMLYPLWSIGVEEQYYLFWAPIVKLFRRKLPFLIITFLCITCIWYYLLSSGVFDFSESVRKFLLTQRFYAMAMGGFFGLIMAQHKEKYKKTFFAGRTAQIIIICTLVYYYLIGYPNIGYIWLNFILTALYGLLILNTSVLDFPVINLEKRILTYLGKISFGLYMYHMVIDYLLRFSIIHFKLVDKVDPKIMMPLYFVALIGGAVLLASLSYKYFESYFLDLNKKISNNLQAKQLKRL